MSQQYFRIEAPYPAIASTMLLAQPQIGNNMGLLSSVVVIKMEDGTRRSFVKSGGGKKRHQWSFTLSSDKMVEFQDFVNRYRGSAMRINWRGNTIIGKATLSPVEFRGDGRANGWPGGEAYETTLELVETE